ncbi:DNA-directed RNA polymerase [Puccinia sorghi]|uniref:DNA-directed RNA polymerase n=1 Tax=Puccinia sorghi TaxID=27349 RepID=A0A0L6VFC4_9BASI|nr:DNA-directed RNA polymerase [Puccinia sorghi]
MPATDISRSALFSGDDVPLDRASQYKSPEVLPSGESRRVVVYRLAHVGGETWDFRRANRYAIRDIERPVPSVSITNIADYETGCREHRDCYGHISVTPTGVKLVPGSLAKRTTENRNLFNEAGKAALERTGRYAGIRYQDFGSARLVIAPSWELDYQEVSVPASLARNFRAISCTDDAGSPLLRYREVPMKEGEWVVLVRPPSLGHSNVQPFRVRIWDKPCILYPGHCSEYHGEFDGDEMQVYHVSSEDSVAECESWAPVGRDPFLEPTSTYLRLLGGTKPKNKGAFMQASNMSIEEIEAGHPMPLLSRESRMRPDMLMEFAQRVKEKHIAGIEVGFRYVAASIAGQSDIRRQQLSQGHIGDIGRQARLAASCFSVDEQGVIRVHVKNSRVVLGTDELLADTQGNMFMRGVNAVCAKAQQALLDSHRAGVTDVVGQNLIEDMMQGSSVTLVSVPLGKEALLPQEPYLKWKSVQKDEIVAIVDTQSTKSLNLEEFKSASSPAALCSLGRRWAAAGVPEQTRVRELVAKCERAVLISCSQSEVVISREETRALSWMLSYNPGAHDLPVTNKIGAMARDLRPFVAMLATHFGTFYDLASQGAFDSYSEIGKLTFITPRPTRTQTSLLVLRRGQQDCHCCIGSSFTSHPPLPPSSDTSNLSG